MHHTSETRLNQYDVGKASKRNFIFFNASVKKRSTNKWGTVICSRSEERLFITLANATNDRRKHLSHRLAARYTYVHRNEILNTPFFQGSTRTGLVLPFNALIASSLIKHVGVLYWSFLLRTFNFSKLKDKLVKT